MSEKPRQEIDITLGGKTYSVCPTFKVLVSIEATTNQPARSLGMKALATGGSADARALYGEMSLAETAAVIFCMVRGMKGAPETADEIGDILVEDGYRDLMVPVGMFLVRAQKGNKEYVKEAIEAEKKAREDAAAKKEAPQQDAEPDPQTA